MVGGVGDVGFPFFVLDLVAVDKGAIRFQLV